MMIRAWCFILSITFLTSILGNVLNHMFPGSMAQLIPIGVLSVLAVRAAPVVLTLVCALIIDFTQGAMIGESVFFAYVLHFCFFLAASQSRDMPGKANFWLAAFGVVARLLVFLGANIYLAQRTFIASLSSIAFIAFLGVCTLVLAIHALCFRIYPEGKSQ